RNARRLPGVCRRVERCCRGDATRKRPGSHDGARPGATVARWRSRRTRLIGAVERVHAMTAEFVFATAQYESGDWDSAPLVPANVIDSIARYTEIPVAPTGISVPLSEER